MNAEGLENGVTILSLASIIVQEHLLHKSARPNEANFGMSVREVNDGDLAMSLKSRKLEPVLFVARQEYTTSQRS